MFYQLTGGIPLKISGFFSTINLQEGSNIILFNDDMKIGIEDNKNDEMMHTTLNQQMNNSNVECIVSNMVLNMVSFVYYFLCNYV